jgi:nucleotide-binding universal stress UspA family protein
MKILLATDGSATAAAADALLAALPLAEETELRAVTVLPDNPSWSEIFGGHLTDNTSLIEEVEKEQRERAERTLAEATAPFCGRLAGVSTAILSGHPGSEILEAAEAWSADLIVVGSRGRRGLTAVLLGSTAEFVAKRAHRSVLVVRGSGQAPERVLLTTDGSEHSRKAMERLRDLPLPPSAQVLVLHVTESFYAHPGLVPTLREEFERTVQEIRRAQRQNADLLVEGTRRFLEGAGLSASGATRTGNPAEEILAAAREEAADLVVTGARGLSATEEFLIGSVSGRLLRYAPCSVLIAR